MVRREMFPTFLGQLVISQLIRVGHRVITFATHECSLDSCNERAGHVVADLQTPRTLHREVRGDAAPVGTNCSETELMQYRRPVGGGPSSNT